MGQNGELAKVIVCGVIVLNLVLDPRESHPNLFVARGLRARTFLPFRPFDDLSSQLALNFFLEGGFGFYGPSKPMPKRTPSPESTWVQPSDAKTALTALLSSINI